MSSPVNMNRIGIQAHCLRREMAVDFAAVLQKLHSMGFSTIDCVLFLAARETHGEISGNSPIGNLSRYGLR
jgi:hypothetical protein